jgi:hypothetical protein
MAAPAEVSVAAFFKPDPTGAFDVSFSVDIRGDKSIFAVENAVLAALKAREGLGHLILGQLEIAYAPAEEATKARDDAS